MPRTVMEILGHTTIRQTMDRYGHALPEPDPGGSRRDGPGAQLAAIGYTPAAPAAEGAREA
jgi:hypothetical protein